MFTSKLPNLNYLNNICINFKSIFCIKSLPMVFENPHQIFFAFVFFAFVNSSSVITQKGESQNGYYKKTQNFPKNEHFLHLTCACVSGGKKCFWFGKFGVLYSLVTPVLRFALLSYYRRVIFPVKLDIKQNGYQERS